MICVTDQLECSLEAVRPSVAVVMEACVEKEPRSALSLSDSVGRDSCQHSACSMSKKTALF